MDSLNNTSNCSTNNDRDLSRHRSTEEEEEYMEEINTARDDTPQSATKRNVRGVTKGLSVQKKRGDNQKLDVVIHPTRNRIVGENAKDFKTEACVVVKQYAPVTKPFWKDISNDDKKKMWFRMKQKFNIEDDVRVKKVIFDQLNRQYRSYRHKLHLHYLKSKKEEGNILEKSPNGVNRNDWKILVEYFESETFQVILSTIFFSMFA